MEDTLTGIILSKSDDLFEEANHETDSKKCFIKAFGSGFIKGMVDGLMIYGTYYFIKDLIKIIKN